MGLNRIEENYEEMMRRITKEDRIQEKKERIKLQKKKEKEKEMKKKN